MPAPREMAAQIAMNYAANAESAQEVIQLLKDSYNTLAQMEGETNIPAPEETQEAKVEPVMAPERAIGQDAITCLVCGKSFKTLKRHLKNAHDMNPQDYRQTFGLDKSYPLVAPNLSQQRAQVAKERGLGERLAEARKQQREEASV